jgi:hypothetical protein
MEQVE